MQKKASGKSRSRAEILAEIAALPPSVQGTISSYRCPRKNGPPAVYHNLQYTRGGKNHSFSIPVDKVSEFRAAVAAKDCDSGESERNAGNHPKRIVTLFGELPPIRHTYWYDEDGYEGRHPFDDRLGLVGRYTPAACADTVRSAVDRPFADAARTSPRSTRSASPPTPCGRSSGCTTMPSATSRRTKATRRRMPGERPRSSASWPTERASRCGRNASRAPRARTGARRRARSRPPRSSGRRRRRTALQAVRQDLVAERSEGAAAAAHPPQVEPPRGVLRLPRQRPKACRLRGMSLAFSAAKPSDSA